ncbi:adenylate/guanylate cyclase domain-containing protein [Marichromatium bheemlicum]|uniref:Guanylate cyclase n=1 Tax=Marichromatium bheemlicum TaxID=365339 RepID=A0ABX1I5K2_9GAMM|nr:adenylate/guanylate cyclase domain-containing protein [Marichromatium bheemlicum]NKN32538.1 guanylate cyclase [Marichromatium bheemlicum]
MQHQDKQLLFARILAAIEGGEEAASAPIDGEMLRERLSAQLDDFLLESQPIIATEATVVIADIRGFTALVESQPVEVMVRLLNRFFTRMVELVTRYGGVVDKFMGDSVMAVFGVPERRDDDLLRALACAVEIQRAMVVLNRDQRAWNEPSLYAGVAVSSGRLMAGSFGSPLYNEYTVIGDPVNLAARIENYSLRGQVLLSESAQAGAREHIEIGAINQVTVKGKAEPVTLYELKAVDWPQRLEVPEVEPRKAPRIAVDFAVEFRQVVSKRILSESFVGKVHDLSYYGMSADLPVVLPPYTEILLSLAPEIGSGKAMEVYARVLRSQRDKGSYRTSLEFTTIDTPSHRRVKRYVDHMLWGH